ncbi:DMT family transporter [uncultured Rhodoferax sp.]|uniref:DMT family transporter n=1 Tax=uncultured Rhodoferax sp. TaxID=223188 RepID=UPI0025DFE686|nr:DMT family transporter [uncultured Rhodoferax sp.]
MHAARKERLALLGLWLIPSLWAVNVIVARMAPGTIAPYALALGRWALAGALLGVVARRELWAQRRAIAADWHHYVVLGFCGMLVCGAWVYLGARTTGAMNIALIYAASPVLIAVGSVLWLGERIRPAQIVGVVVALAGVVHVVVQGQWLALAQVHWVVGDLWIVAAMVSWAAYALLQKLWPSPLGSTARLAAICGGGVLVLLPCALWEYGQPGTPAWGPRALGLVVAAALAPGVAAYWMYGAAQKVLGASRVAVTLYLGPLYAALAAWGVLGEPLGLHHLVGAALILPGVYFVSRRSDA